jgi:molecular chaperone IbpA
MRTFDLTPLLRSTIGFDRVSRLMDAALHMDESALSYPPYNIEKVAENEYRLTMAVAGFGEDDLEVTATEDTLEVTGRIKREDESKSPYLHRGIGTRAFKRRFELADHIKVVGAALDKGLLHIELKREIPEEMRPRTVKIERRPAAKVIEKKAA